MQSPHVEIKSICCKDDRRLLSYLANYKVITGEYFIGVRTVVDGGPLILAWYKAYTDGIEPWIVSMFKFSSAMDFMYWWFENCEYIEEIQFLNVR